jgi:GGDEF domain-containing protein
MWEYQFEVLCCVDYDNFFSIVDNFLSVWGDLLLILPVEGIL